MKTPIQSLLVAALGLFADSLAFAQPSVPPVIPGWQASGSQWRGVPLNSGAAGYSSPVVTEIDGNVSNGPEVAFGSQDGTITVTRSDGVVLWYQPLPSHSCSIRSGLRLYSSPAVGEIFGDGVKHVVIGYGGVDSACDGGVAAFRGYDGSPTWNFSTVQFAKKRGFRERMHGIFSTPALADTDFDGRMEIGFGGFDRNVYLLNANGTVRWYYNAADTVWSSAAFANVDRDRNLEMIIGTDISANRQLRPPTKNGGYVYAFKTAPRKNIHIGFRQRGAYVWQRWLDQVVYSAPIVADVLPNNPGPEVLVGSGCYFPAHAANKKGRWVKILNLKNGRVIKTLKTVACFSSTIAVGDIDDDGVLEVVASVNGSKDVGGDGNSRVQAWNADNPNPIWSTIPRTGGSHDTYGGMFQSPVIADIDGNGSLEVLVSNGGGVAVMNGRDGTLLTCQQASCGDAPLLPISAAAKTTPVITDVNLDGVLDVVLSGSRGGNGFLYSWTNFSQYFSTPPGAQVPFSAPWPTFRGNALRDGIHR